MFFNKSDWDDSDNEIENTNNKDNNTFDIQPKIEINNNKKIKCSKIVLHIDNEVKIEGFNRKTCKSMICLNCDIKIYKYENYIWNESKCDYMFFRTNFGVFDKLKVNLINSEGHLALCCGCSYLTITNPIFISKYPHIKWICIGH